MIAMILGVSGPLSTKSPKNADLARFLRTGICIFLP